MNKHEGNIGCFSPCFCSMKSLCCSLLHLCHFGLSVLSCVNHSSHLHHLCSLLSPKKLLFLELHYFSESPWTLSLPHPSWRASYFHGCECSGKILRMHTPKRKKDTFWEEKKIKCLTWHEVVRVELTAAVAQNGDVGLCLLRMILKDVCGWHRTKTRFKLLLSEVKLTAWESYPDSSQVGAVIC